MESYNPKEIEAKWQEKWLEQASEKIDKDDTKKKFYILDMFPYPSGTGLHMGHTESYTASDVFYRFKKMQGFNVLHPQGFDAFGLPAENYAIKTGVPPIETTKKNMENYIRQMQSLGFNYDFSEQAITSDPEYYKWTQWIFSEFYKNGLVYKKTQKTNWCASCQTVIANEQVVENKCERCGTEIEQKEVPTWFFKITDFAEELIADLDDVDWPEYTKKNQRAWIGKSEGAEIKFEIRNSKSETNSKSEKQNTKQFIEVFTTRVDTVFGVTYVVVAPEHPLIAQLESQIANRDEIFAYIEKSKNKTELDRMEAKEKTGVELEGIKAVNPFNGEEVPVFVADYVLGSYGTGAVMAVPAHDERDFEFAKKYNLPIKKVIEPCFDQLAEPGKIKWDEAFVERDAILAIVKHWEKDEYLCLQWKKVDWRTFITGGPEGGQSFEEAARTEILEETGYKNLKLIKELPMVHSRFYHVPKKVNRFAHFNVFYFELKDGDKDNISDNEQENHDTVWVMSDKIEQFLTADSHKYIFKNLNNPEVSFVEDGVLNNSGEYNFLTSEQARGKMTAWLEEKGLGKKVVNYRLRDWSISRQRYWGCPIPIVYSPEGEPHLVPEQYLPWKLPEDVDFVPTGTSPLAKSQELKERVEKIFGECWTAEYDTMDTFVDSSWYFLRYPDVHNDKEFCSQTRKAWLPVDMYIGGAEHTYMHLLYARFFVKALHKIGHLSFNEPFLKLRHQGMVLDKAGNKMSKSKGNVINPDEMVEKFGADSVRMYMMFVAPLEDAVMWNEENIVGVRRFLERVWRLQEKIVVENMVVDSLTHKTIKKVGEDVEVMKFNTAISQMMILVNAMDKEKQISVTSYELLVTILAPFAPHMAEEIWNKLGHSESIFSSAWPEYDSELIKDEKIKLVIQVNGKVRDTIEVNAEISEDEAKKVALESEKIKNYISGKEIRKIIYVKNKLVSIVV
ncbi:MAG: class I tRNA ligase family protein [Candidatus Moranbacteria bacterium]|nr:class I tRNA ligase family protein [Candidatus Moranbacteria bacterium]